MKKNFQRKYFLLTYLASEYYESSERFFSEEKLNDFLKKNINHIIYFHIDMIDSNSLKTTKGRQYIGNLLNDKDINAQWLSDKNVVTLINNVVKTFANGKIYPLGKYDVVLDKNLKQIYPIMKKKEHFLQALNKKSR
ncbi:MAG: hypothetical protein ACI4N3_02350 [Alphaproteobacteria bacterium]